MKQTVKISIGGIAFNIEEDAYLKLDSYLKTLRDYFQNNSEKDEILSDIEARLNELLQMRLTGKDNIIKASDIDDVINIMGNPKDFNDEDSVNEEKVVITTTEKPSGLWKKKLYRDTESGILGGVCSGLGHYFKVDVVIFRALFILALFIVGFYSSKSGSSVVLLYLILWIAMPKAKTLSQRLSMKGIDPTIESIENREYISSNKTYGSGLIKVLKIMMGVILGFISFAILASIVVIVAVFLGFSGSYDVVNLNDILSIFAVNTLDFKITFILMIALPLIGILYLCLKLLMQSRFGTRDIVISCIAVILWIGTIFYFSGTTLGVIQKHKYSSTATESFSINTQSDTLYVSMPDRYTDSTPIPDENNFYFFKDDNGTRSIFMSPSIELKKDSIETFKVEIKKKAFDETVKLAQTKAKNAKMEYEIQDSSLVLVPRLYNKSNIWDRELFRLIITVPYGKEVVIDEPVFDNYDEYFNF